MAQNIFGKDWRKEIEIGEQTLRLSGQLYGEEDPLVLGRALSLARQYDGGNTNSFFDEWTSPEHTQACISLQERVLKTIENHPEWGFDMFLMFKDFLEDLLWAWSERPMHRAAGEWIKRGIADRRRTKIKIEAPRPARIS